MAENLVRYQETRDLHFVTFSCYRRLPYLATAEARDLVERSLETMRVRYDFFVSAYVVMPNHVHVLMSEPRDVPLAKAIQALKLSVARRQMQRPFWMARYFDRNIFSTQAVGATRRYIHRNPVKREFVTEPDGWPWSSFHHWWTGELGTVEIESKWTARRRGLVAAQPTSQNRDVGHTQGTG